LLNNRQTSNRRRGRGRSPQNGGQRGGNESRIDSRARGNAPQLLEKFKNMAREAQMQGDRVMTEYYLQFSDHYFRIVSESRARAEESRPRQDWQAEDGFDGETSGNEQAFDSHEDQSADRDEGQQERPHRDTRPREPNRDANREPSREQNRDRGERNDRSDRSDRQDRPRGNRNPNGNINRDEDNRPASSSISIDILPPALGVSADPMPDLDDVAPTPKRRGRPKKAEAVEVGD
jgi:Domain of unknown function (DUF4167)